MDRYIVEKHGFAFWKKNKHSGELVLTEKNMDAPLLDKSGIVVAHRSPLFTHERDVTCLGDGGERLDGCEIFRRGGANIEHCQ